MERRKLIRIDGKDNVAIALQMLRKGETILVDGISCTAGEDIPQGHKIALADVKKGDRIIKYGNPIGLASQEIKKGQWVHSHNLETGLDQILTYQYRPQNQDREPGVQGAKAEAGTIRRTFFGYRREDGSVGTRNEIWVVPTVSCVNHTAQRIAQKANEAFGSLCDGVYALPHNAGCSQLGDDHQTTQKILAGIVRHPNAGGVLLVSLGCENNNLKEFAPVLGTVDTRRVKCMVAQEEADEVEAGVALIGEIAKRVSKDKREEVPASALKIGMKCGGSDSLSGVTANPLCGWITDRLTSLGGTSILTEVPEMFGAEHLLMNRADSEKTFGKVVDLINSFKQYYLNYGQPIYENPSPGNKEGGITTLEEKSLGCIQKGGCAAVTDTLNYGERAEKPGLNLMNGPGNDSVSTTNLLAAGAQLLLFTTGRGNPLGTAVPSVKLSSNTALSTRKNQWIDFDAGVLLAGQTREEAGERLWNLILDIASGRIRARNEENGYRDIMIFKNGVLL